MFDGPFSRGPHRACVTLGGQRHEGTLMVWATALPPIFVPDVAERFVAHQWVDGFPVQNYEILPPASLEEQQRIGTHYPMVMVYTADEVRALRDGLLGKIEGKR